MIFILILSAILTILSVNLWRAQRRLPRGPVPFPLIGNLPQFLYICWKTGGLIQGYNELKKQYGKVFTIWIGPIPTVHIADYDVAHETHIKRANTFGHRYAEGAMNYIREGRGIVTSNGDFWQEHRRFALRTLRDFGLGRNIMEERIMEEYRYRFSDYKNTNFKNGAIEVHASSCFDLLVGSIINSLLVSERFEQDDEEFDELKKNIGETFEKASLLDFLTPLWILKSRVWQWRTKEVFGSLEMLYGQVMKSIEKRIKSIENGTHIMSEEGDDFVDAFLIKMEKDKKDGVVDSSFNLDTLAIDLFDLWIGGQETTANTLTWACLCLLNQPEVVEELRRELVEVTGGTRGVSLTDKPTTPYLNATVNEIQRVASILNNNLSRVMTEDTVIDGQPISAGTVVTVQMSMLHSDEIAFKNPTEFNPGRFLENNNLEKTLIPFGIGKRSCPGESLARAELYLILGNLILDYNLEAVGEVPEVKTINPFGVMRRPVDYHIRFVPIL